MEGEAGSNGVVEEPSHSPNMNGASTSVREKGVGDHFVLCLAFELHTTCKTRLSLIRSHMTSIYWEGSKCTHREGCNLLADYQSLEVTNKEVLHTEHSGKRTNLSLQIPLRPVDFNGSHNGKGSAKGGSSTRGILRGVSFQNQADYQSLEPTDKGIIHSEHGGKRTDLSVQIPPRHADLSGSRGGKGSSRGSSSARGILRGPSFKNQVPVLDERSSLLDSDLAARAGPTVVSEKASLATSIASLTWKRCVSLPIRQESILSPSTSISARDKACNEQHPSKKQAIPANVQRSLSMPLRNVVILRSRSSPTSKALGQTDASEDLISPAHLGDGDEEIPEEDAVCRVCLDDLSEGGSSLQLECRCKGALRLIHEECAMKWFGIKGNRMCDVCGAEILNLPVTLIRMPSSSRADGRQQHRVRRHPNSAVTRAWQDVMVLMLISTMCYFFFIEQLLVGDMKNQAVTVAAPFSFVLGILSSVFAVVHSGSIFGHIQLFSLLLWSCSSMSSIL
ncbi:uncharacterized protein LOC131231641 isoform X3 [Magnolia sinica]|uniref:uncharacterized protein LOC131231641 isoform X3 n=1 Tax=Magnolia sinica TaxID=86752 RepID=UPI002658BDFC|nr:uncharacterized protein LOC131231641 isoform X3 [Magnolia sinica]